MTNDRHKNMNKIKHIIIVNICKHIGTYICIYYILSTINNNIQNNENQFLKNYNVLNMF